MAEPVGQYTQGGMGGSMMPGMGGAMGPSMGPGMGPGMGQPMQPQMGITPQQMAQLQAQQQGGADMAGMLNEQLQEVPPNAYVDPRQAGVQQRPPQADDLQSKIPEFLKDPLIIFVLVVVFLFKDVSEFFAKYVPQIKGSDGSLSTAGMLFTGVLVAGTFAGVKRLTAK